MLQRLTNAYRKAGSRGGALAELAVSLPVLTLVLIGAADLGRVWTETSRIENAAYAAAQYGSQSRASSNDEDGMRDIVYVELGFGQSAETEDPNAQKASKAGFGFSPGAVRADLTEPDPIEVDPSGGTGTDDDSDGPSLHRVPSDYDVDVTRYCECQDGEETACEGTIACGVAGNRRTYVQVTVGVEFETIVDYPGIPREINLVREVRLRAR